MSAARVRLYDGIDGRTSLIGFSLSISEAVNSPELNAFLADSGYTVRATHEKAIPTQDLPKSRRVPEYVISYACLEVEPPLRDLDVLELAALFVGATIDGETKTPIVDVEDGVLVYDNRFEEPMGPLDHSGVLLATDADKVDIDDEGWIREVLGD